MFDCSNFLKFSPLELEVRYSTQKVGITLNASRYHLITKNRVKRAEFLLLQPPTYKRALKMLIFLSLYKCCEICLFSQN